MLIKALHDNYTCNFKYNSDLCRLGHLTQQSLSETGLQNDDSRGDNDYGCNVHDDDDDADGIGDDEIISNSKFQ